MKEIKVSVGFISLIGIISLSQSATVFNDGLPALGTACHPSPRDDISQVYVIGYGSLISTSSKNSTSTKTYPNIPVTISGFSRKFNCRGTTSGLSTTFLGVDREDGESFNGVAFRISDLDALRNFDKRERFYCREEVKPDQVKLLVNESNFEGELPNEGSAQYWIYSVKDEYKKWPSKKYPIVQSYVDTFLSGCLEMDETYGFKDYADNCVKLTKGWNYSWVNDRLFPRRPWSFQPKATSIDSLLNKHIPGFYERVPVEGQVSYGGIDGDLQGNKSEDMNNTKNSAGCIGSGWNNVYLMLVSVSSWVLFAKVFVQ